jgi:hypothetical protein
MSGATSPTSYDTSYPRPPLKFEEPLWAIRRVTRHSTSEAISG